MIEENLYQTTTTATTAAENKIWINQIIMSDSLCEGKQTIYVYAKKTATANCNINKQMMMMMMNGTERNKTEQNKTKANPNEMLDLNFTSYKQNINICMYWQISWLRMAFNLFALLFSFCLRISYCCCLDFVMSCSLCERRRCVFNEKQKNTDVRLNSYMF